MDIGADSSSNASSWGRSSQDHIRWPITHSTIDLRLLTLSLTSKPGKLECRQYNIGAQNQWKNNWDGPYSDTMI